MAQLPQGDGSRKGVRLGARSRQLMWVTSMFRKAEWVIEDDPRRASRSLRCAMEGVEGRLIPIFGSKTFSSGALPRATLRRRSARLVAESIKGGLRRFLPDDLVHPHKFDGEPLCGAAGR